MKGRKWTIWTIWTIPRHRGLNQNMTGCLTLSFSVLVRSPSVGASFCVREGLKFLKKYGIFHNMGVRGHTDSWGMKNYILFYTFLNPFLLQWHGDMRSFPLISLSTNWYYDNDKNTKTIQLLFDTRWAWQGRRMTGPPWRQCGDSVEPGKTGVNSAGREVSVSIRE